MLALTILGNNSAIPAFNRHPTAQVVQTAENSFLIDCGEGTQLQMDRYKIRRGKINHIFISHLHGDHYFGLIGLLTSMGLLGRKSDLHLYGPEQLKVIIDLQLKVADAQLPYDLHFHALETETVIKDGAKVIVECFTDQHIPVKGLIGIGGVAKKSPFIMQMMADVMNMPIKINKSEQTCALGAAMFAATAAGIYDKVEDAMQAMGQGFDVEYYPDENKIELYRHRYRKYLALGSYIESNIASPVKNEMINI